VTHCPNTLLAVIQRLNSNPYSLTKSECISVVQEMRQAALGVADEPTHLLQDLSSGMTQALASKPDARMHAREAAEAIAMGGVDAGDALEGYIAVAGDSCDGCAFGRLSCPCMESRCSPLDRSDRKSVIFLRKAAP